jgi:hypothetical protein
MSWFGNNDCDVCIFVLVDDVNMKNLVLVCKYFSEVCSTENFYRRRIESHFGADIHGYVDLEKDSFKKAYRGISPTYNDEKRWEKLEPENYPMYIFGECCRLGYIPIILDMLKTKIMLDDEHDYGDYADVVESKRWEVLDILLDNGSTLANYDFQLMFYMGISGDIEGFKRWIPKGLDLVGDKSSEALRSASRNGHNDLVLFLLQNGANPNIREYVEDWPPLVYAVKYCTVDVVKELVKYGADIHFNDNFIFGTEIWTGFDMLSASVPDPDMLTYLSTLRR